MPNNTQVHRSIKVQFDKGASREETLLGRDYLVVPCVAMVEGVRFGAAQDEPELGLASEFGDTPITWANRPLVLNHPQINGEFVSANSPSVLNEYQFGLTMNPELDDDKLKLEAWIDIERVTALGGEFEETYERILGEEDVEVSVGFFSDLEKKKGKFNGQSYSAIWRNIRPDHLAVLSEGIKGACSVEDGCGIPRLNAEDPKMPKNLKTDKQPVATTGAITAHQCSCGGAHTQEEHTDADDNKPVTQGGLKKMLSDLLKPFTATKEEKALEAHQEQRTKNEAIVLQTIDSSLMDRDVRAMISRALNKQRGSWTYLLGYTQDKAIFEDYVDGQGFAIFQIGINVTDSVVEFVGEPEEVILQTKIVPQGTDAQGVNTQENDMSATTPTPTPTPTNPAPDPNPNPSPTPAPTTPAAITQAAPKVLTAQEYIDQAPAEIRDLLNASLKAQEERKATAIKTLTDSKQNKFTEEFLKTQSVEILENMVALLPGTFQGRPQPTNPQVQSGGASETVPVVRAFKPKTAA